jgi:cytosine deaminase
VAGHTEGPVDLRLTGCRLPDGRGPLDLAIAGGRIVAVGAPPGPARQTIAVDGRLVTPGLVESHIHLDKALLTDRVPPARDVAEAIRVTAEAKRRFTVEDIARRARRALDLAVAAGTTAMRTHVEVDPIVGLKGMEAVLPLKREYAPALELQVCAFAQEGILGAPGTEDLLRRALAAGADLVGGVPYVDADALRHIAIVFELAREFDVDVDFHVDFFDEPEHLHVLEIVEQTLRASWQGRVVVGHLTELAALPPPKLDGVVAAIARAGIGVVCIPTTDLYFMGRRDVTNVRRGLTPVRRLLAAGVPVALASNNIRNPFTPVGTADLTHSAFVASMAAHMGAPDDLRALLETLTTHPARMLRLEGYGLAPGARATLVVWECERPEDIVAALPGRALVVKDGRVTLEYERRVRERWRERA